VIRICALLVRLCAQDWFFCQGLVKRHKTSLIMFPWQTTEDYLVVPTRRVVLLLAFGYSSRFWLLVCNLAQLWSGRLFADLLMCTWFHIEVLINAIISLVCPRLVLSLVVLVPV